MEDMEEEGADYKLTIRDMSIQTMNILTVIFSICAILMAIISIIR